MKSNLKNLIGQKIKRWRLERNITQEQLAFHLGLSQGYINQIENGKRSFTLETLQKVTNALAIPIASIFDEKNKGASVKVFKPFNKKTKKINKKEIMGLLDKLPEDVAKRYVRLMKMELHALKQKR